jgi:ABC-2 type transport system permease protein
MTRTRLFLRQAQLEQLAFWRNPDYAFFTFALPIVLLLVLGLINSGDRVPDSHIRAVNLLVPGILAFGVVVCTYANLAAKIAVLRVNGVLKRIRATPLSPGIYLAGHLASNLTTTLAIAAATIALGWAAFGAAPRPGGLLPLAVGLCLGIVCFAALGLAISVIIPTADASGPITTATYLPLALVSGVFDATLQLPEWLKKVVTLLPIKALSDALQAAYNPAVQRFSVTDLVVLLAWSVLGLVLARRFFRWEP